MITMYEYILFKPIRIKSGFHKLDNIFKFLPVFNHTSALGFILLSVLKHSTQQSIAWHGVTQQCIATQHGTAQHNA